MAKSGYTDHIFYGTLYDDKFPDKKRLHNCYLQRMEAKNM